jgi:hypothetical protein
MIGRIRLLVTRGSNCLERRKPHDEFSAVIALGAFEAPAEPPECSVVKIESALAERGRIDPLPA